MSSSLATIRQFGGSLRSDAAFRPPGAGVLLFRRVSIREIWFLLRLEQESSLSFADSRTRRANCRVIQQLQQAYSITSPPPLHPPLPTG